MKSKLQMKREILEKRLDEIEELKKEIKEEIKGTRLFQANKLLDKYRNDMIEIANLAKKQEEIYKKIYDENYQKHEELCKICNDLEWDDAFNEICPLAYICGYFNDGYNELKDYSLEDEEHMQDILKRKVFKKEDIRVWEDEEE